MGLPEKCPLCSKYDDIDQYRSFFRATEDRQHRTYDISCARCGDYTVGRDLYEDRDGLPQAPENKLLHLSKLARRQTGSDALLVLTWENWKDFDHPPGRARGPEEYYDIVLQELASRCRYPGDSTPAFFACQAAAACELPTTVMLGIARQLEESNLWKIGNKDLLRYSVTPQRDAWERLAKLTVRRDPSRRAFVAMWFDPSMRPAYDAIATMLQDEGYQAPFRVDDPHHDALPETQSKIDDRILAEIRACRFIIADFTGNRQAVYYEAGFAEGLSIPVLWCCRGQDDDTKQLNFDTRQHEHIFWKDEADLASRLRDKIRRRGWSWVKP